MNSCKLSWHTFYTNKIDWLRNKEFLFVFKTIQIDFFDLWLYDWWNIHNNILCWILLELDNKTNLNKTKFFILYRNTLDYQDVSYNIILI